MPTKNPKISAYVPQVVHDAFTEYQNDRGLSMSQAAIEIFVNYLGLNLEEPQQEYTSGLPGRLIQLEKSLAELKELYLNLASKVEQIKTTSEPLSEPENSTPQPNGKFETTSELLSSLPDELPQEEQAQPINESDLVGSEPLVIMSSENGEVQTEVEVPGNSTTEVVDQKKLEGALQLNFIDSSSGSPSSLLKELSLPAIKLGERLSIDRKKLSTYAKEQSVEDVAAMTASKDPDSIAWVYSEQLKRYVPHGNLSTEQIQNLKAWKERQSNK